MIRALILSAIMCLTWAAARAEIGLPHCGPTMEGEVSEAGCSCGYERGGSLSGRPAGWRWHCDLLRGPGADAPVISAGPAPQPLPPGLVYAPQTIAPQTAAGQTGAGQTGSSRFSNRPMGY